MIQLSRTQDEEVGDGTTSVIILGECAAAAPAGALSQRAAAPQQAPQAPIPSARRRCSPALRPPGAARRRDRA
jgi:hypothetical protein